MDFTHSHILSPDILSTIRHLKQYKNPSCSTGRTRNKVFYTRNQTTTATMQFNVFALIASALAVAPALAQPPTASVLNYDAQFDNPSGTLGSTACSADVGPLRGIHTFGDIPTFPHIAGSFLIEGFNSTRCGACYELLYNRADGTQVVLPFTIINTVDRGFTPSVQGMHDLTGFNVNNFPGDVPIFYKEVPEYDCGL
ncbi:hypothetical protein D9756_007943 [Leucocoprinus leucothites]|uniref:Allergen Asp f 15 n=1 Tax=Leucocoprinus leucothites TaxID=201217 RepID=A0A8H5D461_9AGAR|nr:hypothetical protein D9756_007943 [Leucoagaricus leucothites]